MTIIKSLSVGNGDLYYIKHGTDSFTIIDCNIHQEDKDAIIAELKNAANGKGIKRFISTHPDEDHIHGIEFIDNYDLGWNFYCVKNNITKEDETPSFKRYKSLRDNPDRSYYIYQGCQRKWLNNDSDERGSAGINILWPNTSNACFLEQLEKAEQCGEPNNISPIIKYSLNNGVVAIWMGDLETSFMNQIVDEVQLPRTDILFAPHHGRKSGFVPKAWLDAMSPKVVVVGEAPSEDLNYYCGYSTITQNRAGDIEFDCSAGNVDVRVSSPTYSTGFLRNDNKPNRQTVNGVNLRYIGSFDTWE